MCQTIDSLLNPDWIDFTMRSDINTIKSIPNNKPVRIFLPIQETKERYRASCIFEATAPPKFNLLFKPGVLPVDSIDTKQSCIISVDMGGPNISLEARIQEIVNDQTIAMIVEKSISHDQMREFFRVDTTTDVISKSFHSEFFNDNNEPWSIAGKTIDISGSGILASFNESPPLDKQIRLEITLPTPEPETISVLAHPVRSQQVGDNQFDVAYHFDDISTEDRDKIIGCCLIIQRRLLRLKVQVKNPSLT